MPKRVVIVGAGITGLVAAYDLERRSDAEILVIERDPDFGGKLHTERIDDFVVEKGPDCFFTHKKWALEFIEEIGLTPELREPTQNQFSMLIGGRLRPVPRGLLSFSAIDSAALDEAEFLSPEAKEQVRNEHRAPIGNGKDESIATFFRRRFGDEFSKLISEPLLAGTHAGDPDRLSMAALYPNYLEAERKYGSLAAAPKPPAQHLLPPFLSFRGGMDSLAYAVHMLLKRPQFLFRTNVERVLPGRVVTDRGIEIEVDQVLLTVPSFSAAEMTGIEPLRSISYVSSAIVHLGFSKESVSGLVGTGFLVPPSEPAEITGATWISHKWPGRASSMDVLTRVFIGRSGTTDVMALSDEDLTAKAFNALSKVATVNGPATLSLVSRWPNGLPQYEVGHLDRLALIEEELLRKPGIHLAGASYRGVGIPDCIRQGREAAARIIIEMA